MGHPRQKRDPTFLESNALSLESLFTFDCSQFVCGAQDEFLCAGGPRPLEKLVNCLDNYVRLQRLDSLALIDAVSLGFAEAREKVDPLLRLPTRTIETGTEDIGLRAREPQAEALEVLP